MTIQRIFDNPNHPQYGPVRRMWVILAQLDLLDSADEISIQYRNIHWDIAYAGVYVYWMKCSSDEAYAAKQFLTWLLRMDYDSHV